MRWTFLTEKNRPVEIEKLQTSFIFLHMFVFPAVVRRFGPVVTFFFSFFFFLLFRFSLVMILLGDVSLATLLFPFKMNFDVNMKPIFLEAATQGVDRNYLSNTVSFHEEFMKESLWKEENPICIKMTKLNLASHLIFHKYANMYAVMHQTSFLDILSQSGTAPDGFNKFFNSKLAELPIEEKKGLALLLNVRETHLSADAVDNQLVPFNKFYANLKLLNKRFDVQSLLDLNNKNYKWHWNKQLGGLMCAHGKFDHVNMSAMNFDSETYLAIRNWMVMTNLANLIFTEPHAGVDLVNFIKLCVGDPAYKRNVSTYSLEIARLNMSHIDFANVLPASKQGGDYTVGVVGGKTYVVELKIFNPEDKYVLKKYNILDVTNSDNEYTKKTVRKVGDAMLQVHKFFKNGTVDPTITRDVAEVRVFFPYMDGSAEDCVKARNIYLERKEMLGLKSLVLHSPDKVKDVNLEVKICFSTRTGFRSNIK